MNRGAGDRLVRCGCWRPFHLWSKLLVKKEVGKNVERMAMLAS